MTIPCKIRVGIESSAWGFQNGGLRDNAMGKVTRMDRQKRKTDSGHTSIGWFQKADLLCLTPLK